MEISWITTVSAAIKWWATLRTVVAPPLPLRLVAVATAAAPFLVVVVGGEVL